MPRLPMLLIAACAIFVPACRTKPEAAVQAAAAPSVVVSAVPVEPRPFTAVVPVTGTLVSRTRVEVRAETFGRVLRFPKEEGERVRAGEAVIWVEEDNYRLALKQAESSVQVAAAALARSKVLATHAQAELDRAENLIKSGGITDKDFKLAATAEQDARSQVLVGEAQLDQARTAVAIARKKLDDTAIRAPVDGEIQRKIVNVGAYVEAPTPVFSIIDNQRIELEAAVPAAEIAQVRSGMPVTFKVTSYPEQTFEGRVIELLPSMDAESRSAKVRVAVGNGSGRLKAGMFAEGEVLTGVRKSAVVIPAGAVHRDDSKSAEGMVYVVDNGQAARRKILLGREWNGSVEVVGGLKPGELLITDQSLELAEGVHVRVRDNGHVSQ